MSPKTDLKYIFTPANCVCGGLQFVGVYFFQVVRLSIFNILFP